MIYNAYTILKALADNNDPQIANIVDKYGVMTATRNTSTRSSNLIHMVTMAPIAQPAASDKLTTLLALFKENGDDMNRCFCEMTKLLNNEGIVKLLTHLLAAHPDHGELVNSMVANVDDIAVLFKGMPLFCIEVVDERPTTELANGLLGRFDIYLKKINTNERFLIEFSTKESKVLYVWFLLHPREEFMHQKLKSLHMQFVHLFDTCYPNTDKNTIDEKRIKNVVDKSGRDAFDQFWVYSLSAANRHVRAALAERDDEEWYTVVNENKQAIYTLSLPEERISLPDVLLKQKQLWKEKSPK